MLKSRMDDFELKPWHRQFLRCLFPYSSERLRIEEAFIVKHMNMPEKLYKYRSFNSYHKDALEKGILFMAPPQDFNDPYDTAVTFDYKRILVEDIDLNETRKRIAALKSGNTPEVPPKIHRQSSASFSDHIRKMFDAIMKDEDHPQKEELFEATTAVLDRIQQEQLDQFIAFNQANFRVLSLSENILSHLMWSHYANSHKGFAIEYDYQTLPRDDLRRRLCYPVLYTSKRRDATRYHNAFILGHGNPLFAQYFSLLKFDVWAYEREWRMIHTLQDSVSREIVMPTPSSLIAGARIEEDDEAYLREIAEKLSIPVRKASIGNRDYTMKIVDAA